MKRNQLTQEAFAARAELGKSTIKDLLSGPPAKFNPTIGTLMSYLSACDKNLGNLFDFMISSLHDDAELLRRARDNPITAGYYKALIDHIRAVEEET